MCPAAFHGEAAVGSAIAAPLGAPAIAASRAVKSKAALLLAAVVRQQGPAAYNTVIPQLMQQAVQPEAAAAQVGMVSVPEQLEASSAALSSEQFIAEWVNGGGCLTCHQGFFFVWAGPPFCPDPQKWLMIALWVHRVCKIEDFSFKSMAGNGPQLVVEKSSLTATCAFPALPF
jgi:hypothetical protein